MQTNFFGQDLKENYEHFDIKDSKINLLSDRQEDKNNLDKITKSPYSQNLKKQLVQLNKKYDFQSSVNQNQDQYLKNQNTIQDHIVNISNFPERCYINRIIEYKMPDKLKNPKIVKNKKLYESVNYDENFDDSASIIIRQQSYLRLRPEDAFSRLSQNKQNDHAPFLPPIKKNLQIENNRYDNKQAKSVYKKDLGLINNSPIIKKLIKNNANINEKLIQSINRTYLQQQKCFTPVINNKNTNNSRNSDYTSLSKQTKRIQDLNNSYNCISLDLTDDKKNTSKKIKQLSLHRNNESFTIANSARNQSFRQMYNNQSMNIKNLDTSYLNISLNKDLYK